MFFNQIKNLQPFTSKIVWPARKKMFSLSFHSDQADFSKCKGARKAYTFKKVYLLG